MPSTPSSSETSKNSPKRPLWKRLLIWGLPSLFLLMQFIPVDRANPPAEGPIEAPPEVLEVLERACFDCHSNETRWPWYGYVAPTSWLLAHDVEEGREHLNFSNWKTMKVGKRQHALEEIWEEIEEKEMPLPAYEILHPSARLSDKDMDILRRFTENAAH